jgi:cytochrome P450
VYRNDELRFWALSRWDDVLAASLAHDVYSSAKGTVLELDASSSFPIIIFMDPPRQTRLRRLVSKAFTPARIGALEPFIRRTAVELLDRMGAGGRGDFIADFAARLPIAVISAMIGVPDADREMIRKWTDESLTRDADTPQIPANALEANVQLYQHFYRLAIEKRERPGDDMTSLLARRVHRRKQRVPAPDRRRAGRVLPTPVGGGQRNRHQAPRQRHRPPRPPSR